jgi:VCBS repeat protein/FG-GAP repeat protein
MSRWGQARLAAGMAVACLGLVGCVFYLNPQCDDQIRNGSETDIDCGGSCGKCQLGRSCDGDPDCDNGVCVDGTCAPLPCANGIKDGAETDVDCGGGTCRRCAGGRECGGAGDCFGGVCDQGTCASLRTISFADAVAYAASFKTYVLLSGDFDRDGHLDLAAANEQDNSVSVFINLGDGTYRRTTTDFPTGNYPTGGAVADFNRDGIPDIVTANYHGNSVSVLFGVGDGTFEAPQTYPTADGAATSNLAVGDLNGDGFPDVVATNPDIGSFSQLMGLSDGRLQPAINVPVGIQGGAAPFSAAIGDFDGDGKNDLAIAEMTSRSIIVRLGNGDGSFAPEKVYSDGGTPAYIVIARDMDLDGKLDIVVANRGSDDVSVLINRGDGTFFDPVISDTGAGTGPYSVAVADFNLDGVPDVVTANFMTSTASVLLGIGNGSFEAPISAGSTGVLSYGVAAGDFNGDTKPDLATCNAVSNNVTVKINTSH